MTIGYDGLPPAYIGQGSPLTPNLGLSLFGMDPVVAENFWLIDVFAAGGGGTSVFVNSVSVSNPNFNDTTPAAPAGFTNILWQVSGSSVSAYASTGISGLTPGTLPVAATSSTLTDSIFTQTGIFGNVSAFNINSQVGAAGLTRLNVHSETANVIGWFVTHRNLIGNGTELDIGRSRGTELVPLPNLSGDALGQIGFLGYGGATATFGGYAPGANIIATVTENWSPTANGTKLQFFVVPNGSITASERLTILQNGFVGINVAAPTFIFQTDAGKSVALGVATTAPTDGDITNSQIVPYLDQSGNNLKVRIKYSDNTLHLATVPLDTTIVTTSGLTATRIPVAATASSLANSALTDTGTIVSSTEPFSVTATPVSSTFNGVTVSSVVDGYYTNLLTSGSFAGLNAGVNVNPSGSSSASSRGIFANVTVPSTNAQNISGLVIGANLNVFHIGSGILNKATRSLVGITADVEITGSGSATDVRGLDAIVKNGSTGSGTTAAIAAFRGVSGVTGSGGTATTTNDYVFFADTPTKATNYTMTHHFAFYAANGQTGGTGNSDGWAFYVAGTTGGDRSQFGPIYYLTQVLPNFTSGGSIGTAALTVDISPSISITQSTAGQTLTLPNPTLATAGDVLYINNTGSVSFTILSVVVPAGTSIVAIWTGSAWAATTGTAPQTKASVASQWLNSYTASTGVFTSSQPAFTDISGTASANQYVTMVGDSGAGGTKGAVPAPAAGDAAAGKFLKADGTFAVPAGAGSVTSVAMTGDGVIFNATVGGSPITTTGTLVPALLTQTANFILAGPTSGGAATPTFRALVAADIPSGAPVAWSSLTAAIADLTLANTTFNSTWNNTSAATYKWVNTTPTVVSLVLTQVAVSGGSVTYTGTITGGGSNAYVGASVTFAGFVNAGNNVAAQTITASTATTLVVATTTQTNETHAGTAVSSAAVASPIHSFATTYTTGSASAVDAWTIQDVVTGVAANGKSSLTFAHSGSSGAAGVLVPILQIGTNACGLSNVTAAQIGVGNGTQGDKTGFLLMAGATFGGATATADMNFNAAKRMGFDAQWFLAWSSATGSVTGSFDSGISRITTNTLGIGTGTAGSVAGNLQLNTITNYGGTATVAQGIPSEIATIDLTAQSAAIAATNIVASAPRSGLYRVSVYAKITTASSTSSVLGGTNGLQLTWTDPTDSTTPTVAVIDLSSAALNANTTTTVYLASTVISAKSATAIQYAFDYTSVGVTAMQFKISIRLEAL